MINQGKLLVLITARGGSKRLPGKNLKELAGKPLIVWSIEAAKHSKYVDRVVVSTDCEDIAKISKESGAEVPFIRPVALADDTAASIDVVRYAVTVLEEEGNIFDYLLLLQPTSPLRTAKHIDEAVELLLEKKADGIVGVTEIDHPIEWTNCLKSDLSMDDFFPRKIIGLRSQDFPKRYLINGAIYLCKISRILEENTMILNRGGYAYIMSQEDSIDIDRKLDFMIAESIIKKRSSDE
jgi:CMP-N-acetylneuraminic acid synthetase